MGSAYPKDRPRKRVIATQKSKEWGWIYSPSKGATSGVSSTWTPPRFLFLLSANGNFQPPSSSGVDSHSRIKCLLGAGGAWSTYAVLAWNVWLLLRNWMSPTSRIMCRDSCRQVCSSTSTASRCSGDKAGISPALEKRSRDVTKYGSHLMRCQQARGRRQRQGGMEQEKKIKDKKFKRRTCYKVAHHASRKSSSESTRSGPWTPRPCGQSARSAC